MSNTLLVKDQDFVTSHLNRMNYSAESPTPHPSRALHCTTMGTEEILGRNSKVEEDFSAYLQFSQAENFNPTLLPTFYEITIKGFHDNNGVEDWSFSPFHIIQQKLGFVRFVTENQC